jgi:exosortase/archaeosortase family protein
VIDNIMWISGGVLQAMGYPLIPEPEYGYDRYLGIDGGTLLWIGDPCNGVSLFAVFLIFLIAYPGPLKHKIWFGAAGVLSIHLVNNLRVVALCIISKYHFDWLSFQHDYTFYVIVYGWVFFLWYLWVKRFGPKRGGVRT